MTFRVRAGIQVLTSLMLIPALAAIAAEGPPPEEETGGLEEIIITARKREESMQTVPIAVTAFTQKRLERGEIRDLQDIEGLVPTLVVDPVTAGPQGAALSLRGIEFSDIEKSFDPAVGVVVDGVFVGTNTMQLATNFDIQRLEILRGPQGTLFGKNTTAGVINIVTTEPTGELEAMGKMTFGTFNRQDYMGRLNFPIIPDMLAAKVSFQWLNSDGPYRNQFDGKYQPQTDFFDGIVDVKFDPMDDLTMRVKYEHVRDRSQSTPLQNASGPTHILCFGGAFGLLNFPGQCEDPSEDKFHINQNFPNEIENDGDNITGTIDWAFHDDYSIKSITAWRHNRENVTSDFDAVPFNFFSTQRIQNYSQVTQELQLSGDPFETLHFQAGLYYWWAEYQLDQNTFHLFEQPFIGLPPGSLQVTRAGQESTSLAGFLQFDWELDFIPMPWDSTLTMTGGGRFTWEEKKFHNSIKTQTAGGSLLAINVAPLATKESWKEPNARLGLDWQITDEHLAYFSWSRGFKSGGFNGRAGSTISSLTPYDPETVDQFEIGAKTDWFDNRLRANVAAFFTDYVDKQEQVVVPVGGTGQETITENAGSAEIWGVELEVVAVPIDSVNMFLSVGWLDAQYKDFRADLNGPDANGVLMVRDNTDFELRRAPEWTIGVGASYTHEMDWGRGIIDVQYRWRDEMRAAFSFVGANANGIDPGSPDDRGLARQLESLDFALTAEIDDLFYGSWRVTGFIRNMTDDVKQAAFLDVGGLFAFKANNVGRTFGIDIQANF